AGIDALQTERPGIDRVAGARDDRPAVVAGGRRRRGVTGMGVVLVVGARRTDREVTEAHLDTGLIPGRLGAGGAARRSVLGEGPLATAADRQVPATEVMAVVSADRQDVVARIARPRRRDVGAVGLGRRRPDAGHPSA